MCRVHPSLIPPGKEPTDCGEVESVSPGQLAGRFAPVHGALIARPVAMSATVDDGDVNDVDNSARTRYIAVVIMVSMTCVCVRFIQFMRHHKVHARAVSPSPAPGGTKAKRRSVFAFERPAFLPLGPGPVPLCGLHPFIPAIVTATMPGILIALHPEISAALGAGDRESTNAALQGYLTITGVVYSLILSQIMQSSESRIRDIRSCIALEVGGLHRAHLLVMTARGSAAQRRTAATSILRYAECMHASISSNQYAFDSWASDVRTAFSSVPTLLESDDACNMMLVGRLVDVINQVGTIRGKRCALEMERVTATSWAFMLFLANSMFVGILLLDTGARILNMGLCIAVTVSITWSLFIIGDLDTPYRRAVRTMLPLVDILLADLTVPAPGGMRGGGKETPVVNLVDE